LQYFFSIATGIAILVACLVLHVVLQYLEGWNIAILGSNTVWYRVHRSVNFIIGRSCGRPTIW